MRIGNRRVRHFSLLRSGLRKTETAPCGDSIAGHFSKSVRSGAPGNERVIWDCKIALLANSRMGVLSLPFLNEKGDSGLDSAYAHAHLPSWKHVQ